MQYIFNVPFNDVGNIAHFRPSRRFTIIADHHFDVFLTLTFFDYFNYKQPGSFLQGGCEKIFISFSIKQPMSSFIVDGVPVFHTNGARSAGDITKPNKTITKTERTNKNRTKRD